MCRICRFKAQNSRWRYAGLLIFHCTSILADHNFSVKQFPNESNLCASCLIITVSFISITGYYSLLDYNTQYNPGLLHKNHYHTCSTSTSVSTLSTVPEVTVSPSKLNVGSNSAPVGFYCIAKGAVNSIIWEEESGENHIPL